MQHFPFELKLRIDWSDMDLFGHVNNIAYFRYMQSSRVQCWEQCQLTEQMETDKQGPILLSTHCRFIKALNYPGHITVKAGITFIKNTSFGLLHHLHNEQDELCAIGEDVVVMYDFLSLSKMELPPAFRAFASRLA